MPSQTNLQSLPDNLPPPEDDGGADHLVGMQLPNITLPATSGAQVNLSELQGRIVVYAYPMTGVPNVALPEGWNDIPGARGCTPQAQSFQDQKDVIAALGAQLFGLSTQPSDYQQEMAVRLGLSFPILSDADFKLTEALRLPTMTVEGMRLTKRLTLVIDDGVIAHVFYPVFPPDRATADVVNWLLLNPTPGQIMPGVLIYTTAQCPYCKAAKALLTKKGVAFTEVDVEQDPAAAHVMMARSGRKTVPQVFIGQTHVGGADDLEALSLSGQLDVILAEH